MLEGRCVLELVCALVNEEARRLVEGIASVLKELLRSAYETDVDATGLVSLP